MNYVIFDLDGTIADNGHRVHYLEQKPKDWDSYNDACMSDKLKPNIAELMRLLICQGLDVIILTGRIDTVRAESILWLRRNGIVYDHLIMRKDGDYRSDTVVKWEMYMEQIFPNYKKKPIFVVEDRNKVVAMWREKGITCLQCAYGDF